MTGFEDRIAMSQRERDVLKVLQGVLDGKRSQAEAARLLDVTARHVRRLLKRLEAEGDGALVHGLRGRPSNRRLDEEARAAILKTIGPAMPILARRWRARNCQLRDGRCRRRRCGTGCWRRGYGSGNGVGTCIAVGVRGGVVLAS